MLRRSGLTILELAAALCCIGILALILLPVIASAPVRARQNSCLANLKQLGTAALQYAQDYDEKFYPNRQNCKGVCRAYLDGRGRRLTEALSLTGGAERRMYWPFLLNLYAKDFSAFQCPNNADAFVPGGAKRIDFTGAPGGRGVNEGGENSYGYNDAWMSPGGVGVSNAAIPRVAATILLTDASYYAVAPDMKNKSGVRLTAKCGPAGKSAAPCSAENVQLLNQDKTSRAYHYYWENIGNANWSAGKGTLSAAQAVTQIKMRHHEQINCQFVDSHAKAMPWNRVVGDICLWTTDIEGPHPQCNWLVRARKPLRPQSEQGPVSLLFSRAARRIPFSRGREHR